MHLFLIKFKVKSLIEINSQIKHSNEDYLGDVSAVR